MKFSPKEKVQKTLHKLLRPLPLPATILARPVHAGKRYGEVFSRTARLTHAKEVLLVS